MEWAGAASQGPPVKEIPGTHALSTVGAVISGFEYMRGIDNFFKRRVEKYKSTVLRVNMPLDNPVITLLDGKSFPVLYDLSKVEKNNVILGSYMISTDYTGGYRSLASMDPSDKKHHCSKSWCLQLLSNGRERYFPEFARVFDELSVAIEKGIASSGKASFSDHIEQLAFNFLCRTIMSTDPVAPGPASLGNDGPWCIKRWLGAMIAPISSSGALSKLFDGVKIHCVPMPFSLVSGYYNKLYNFMWTNASSALDAAENQFGLNKEEACNHLLLWISGNAVLLMPIMFNNMAKYIARAGSQLQRDLAEEVRGAVAAHGGINPGALESMALVRSTSYEVLRIEPPFPCQFARARKDFLAESHDGLYAVKKGEMLCGYQPFATKDPKVFDRAEEFVPRRFMGDEGEKLLKHLLWSNGRETDEPSADNKQCAGKDIVVTAARLFLAHFFLRYDAFALEESSSSISFTMLSKAIF